MKSNDLYLYFVFLSVVYFKDTFKYSIGSQWAILHKQLEKNIHTCTS